MLRLVTLLTICNSLLITAGTATAETLLPAYVLQLPESVHDVFIADTGSATIYRFERSSSGLGPGQEGYMSIGQRGVGKQRSGDRRTPLGVYFVVDQLDTSRLHEKYGVTAFPLDYPNVWDRQQLRTGDGIWVHGVPPGGERRPPQDTDGCIALPNEDLAALADKFVPLVTPVIIAREMRWASAQAIEHLRSELLTAVNTWAENYGSVDLHAYLSMYADDFSFRGMSLGEWASFRLQTIEQRGVVDVLVDELLLLADPEEEGLFIARFQETLRGPELRSHTTKRLYWRRNEEGEWRIVAEDNG